LSPLKNLPKTIFYIEIIRIAHFAVFFFQITLFLAKPHHYEVLIATAIFLAFEVTALSEKSLFKSLVAILGYLALAQLTLPLGKMIFIPHLTHLGLALASQIPLNQFLKISKSFGHNHEVSLVDINWTYTYRRQLIAWGLSFAVITFIFYRITSSTMSEKVEPPAKTKSHRKLAEKHEPSGH